MEFSVHFEFCRFSKTEIGKLYVGSALLSIGTHYIMKQKIKDDGVLYVNSMMCV